MLFWMLFLPLPPHWGLSPAGLRNAGERSEPHAAARQETPAHSKKRVGSADISGFFKSWFPPSFPLSLLRQGKQTGASAQETPVAYASSFNPRTAFGRSVAQQEPHTPGAPNSNRCLICGLG